jgi:perosamine synthetase
MKIKNRIKQILNTLPFLPQHQPKLGNLRLLADTIGHYLESGGWLTEHEVTVEFEQKVAAVCKRKYCLCVPSGTFGLILAVRALMKMKRGALKIIVPDFTHPSTANSITFSGSQAIPIDIEPETWGLDKQAIELLDNKIADAVMIVDINGQKPVLYEKIREVANQRGAFIIEDARQAFGSYQGGSWAGGRGEVSVISFSPHKIITTGQGGAILLDDEELYKILKQYKNFGREEEKEVYPEFGINAKFTDLQALIGLHQLTYIDDRMLYKYNLWKKVYGWEAEFLPWFLYALPASREKFKDFCQQRQIGVRDFYPALHTLPMYSNWNKHFRYPEAVNVAIHGVWLPSSFDMTADEIHRIKETLIDYIGRWHDVKLSHIFERPASTIRPTLAEHKAKLSGD